MAENKENTDSCCGGAIINSALALGSLSAGAYNGFCDAQGIPIDNASLEWMVTFGPTVIRGIVGTIEGLINGLVIGGIGGAALNTMSSDDESFKKNAIKGATVGSASGMVVFAGIGGTYSAAKGGVQTLVGYGLGYVAGYIAK